MSISAESVAAGIREAEIRRNIRGVVIRLSVSWAWIGVGASRKAQRCSDEIAFFVREEFKVLSLSGCVAYADIIQCAHRTNNGENAISGGEIASAPREP